MDKLIHSLDLLKRYISVNLRSQMQYRLSFVFDVFGTVILTFTEFGAFALVLLKFENIGGWSIGEVAFLYGTINASFGIMDMFFSGFDPRNFGRHVRMGTFDQLLLRPGNITIQVLGLEFQLRRIGKIFIGFAILLYSVQATSLVWTGEKLLVLIFAIIGQVAYFGGLFVIGATITFWTVESIEVINIFTYGGTDLIGYPMNIYPEMLRKFFTYILPAIFLNYYPALYILGKPDPFNLSPYAHWFAPLAGFFILFIAFRFWHFGISKYQSTGS